MAPGNTPDAQDPARAAREVGEAAAGVFFTPPAGWQAAMEQGRYVIASETEPGVLLVLRSSVASLGEARALLAEGWVEPGAELLPDGAPAELARDTLLAPLRGTVSGQRARAALLCRLSPHGGAVVVLGLAGEEDFREALVGHVRALGASLRFAAPDTEALLAPWDRHLRGHKLVFLELSPSGGPDGAGPPAAPTWTGKKELALAADGSFTAVSSFPEGGGAVGRAGGTSGQAADAADVAGATGARPRRAGGTWALIAVAGQPALELCVAGEAPVRLALSMRDGQTLLDGVRWFIAEE